MWRAGRYRSEPAMTGYTAEDQAGSCGQLERVLRAGHFAVTTELTPPDTVNPGVILERAAMLAPVCDAITATDGPGGNCHMSSIATCAIMHGAGFSAVMQVNCRDRNRIAIQGDVMGAAAMGIDTLLCITGDDVTAGDHPGAKRVFDMDSIQAIRAIRTMCDEGRYLSGRKIEYPPSLLIGGVDNPFRPPFGGRVVRLGKKIRAGAQFIITQYCFDVPRLRAHLQRARELGLGGSVYYIVGIGPLRSAKGAEFMRARVPGVHIPDSVVDRMRKTPSHLQLEEGKRICLEIIEELREIPEISGIHVMAFKAHEIVGEIIAEADLLPRPAIGDAAPPAPARRYLRELR
jgi:methylenetetrahydrofolate reductase (NADPH)